MQVVEINSFGGPDVLEVAERPAPTAGDGQVVVTVTAATVNPVDIATRAGAFAAMLPAGAFPLVLGWDLAGRLDGRPVVGMVPFFAAPGGTYAQQVVADPAWLVPLPDGVDPVAAATVPLNGLTARQGLAALTLQAGATVLVTGASGGVGGFAVQLASAAGAHVVAVASAGDEEYVRSLGAKDVLSRPGSDAALVDAVLAIAPGGVDAVFDTAAIGTGVLGAVRDGGAYEGVTPVSPIEADRGIRAAQVSVAPDADGLRALVDAFAAGRLVTRVAATLPLAEAAQAHRLAAQRGGRGKVVLVA